MLQAATLAALAMAGVVDVYEHRNKTNQVKDCLCSYIILPPADLGYELLVHHYL